MKKYLIILFLFLGLSNLYSIDTYKLDSVNFRYTKNNYMESNSWLGWQKVPKHFKVDVDENKIILYTNSKIVYTTNRLTETTYSNYKTISGFFKKDNDEIFITIYYYFNNKKYIDLSYIYDGFMIKYLIK